MADTGNKSMTSPKKSRNFFLHFPTKRLIAKFKTKTKFKKFGLAEKNYLCRDCQLPNK